MPHDLEFLQLALAQDALGTIDGCDYVRIDAIWCLPHDGAAPTFYGAANLWEQSPAGRAIGRERYIADLEHALAVRDAKILELGLQLANRAAPPADSPCPVDDCPATYPHDRALSMHMQRKHGMTLKAWQARATPPEPTLDAPPEPPPMRAVAAMQAAPIAVAVAAPGERVSCPDCNKTFKSKQSLYSHCQINHPQPIVIPGPPALAELQVARHWVCTRCGSDAFAPSVGDASCCMRCAASA